MGAHTRPAGNVAAAAISQIMPIDRRADMLYPVPHANQDAPGFLPGNLNYIREWQAAPILGTRHANASPSLLSANRTPDRCEIELRRLNCQFNSNPSVKNPPDAKSDGLLANPNGAGPCDRSSSVLKTPHHIVGVNIAAAVRNQTGVLTQQAALDSIYTIMN